MTGSAQPPARRVGGLAIGALLSSASAWALPVDQSAEGINDDARLILGLPSKAIEGDERTRCTMRIIVGSEHVPFSHGDQVTVEVIEDDPLDNDELFRQVLAVTPLEVGGGAFDRVVDCSGAFGEDGGDSLEVFAKALVEKDDCGIGCRQDRPVTEVLELQVVGDDGSEELDDQAAGATEVGEGDVGERVAMDQDWYVFRATGGVRTIIDIIHRPLGGELVAWIEGNQGVVENRLRPTAEGGRLEADLSDGIWFIVVSPARAEDPNFYDLRLAARPPDPRCTPGEVVSEPCGACGTVDRTCDAEGQWPPLLEGDCQGEGECRPGETLQGACDRCGSREDVCDDQCAWSRGACAGGGECDPGTWQSEDCADDPADPAAGSGAAGVRSRVCRDACIWSAYGPCRTPDDPGGACTPASEDCADGVDNDCDGAADGDDLDCAAEQAGGWRLGLSDPCERTSDCDPDPAKGLECVGPPQHPMFEDGYCAQVSCVFPEACASAGGVCGVAFGQVWCLRPCVVLADCRLGHHCATLGESAASGSADPVKACVPVCRGHADCRRGPKTFCSPRSGRCEFPPDQPPGTSTSSGSDDDGGCAVSVTRATPTTTWPGTLGPWLRR